MMIPIGMGDAPPSSASTAVLAPPTVGLLNVTQQADMTHSGTFNPGDQYEVIIMNAAANQPVSLNGSVVGTTSNPDGTFTYHGTVGQSSITQSWSVPAGPSGYASLGTIGNLSQSLNLNVSGSSGVPSGVCRSIIPGIGPQLGTQCISTSIHVNAADAILGLAALVVIISMGGK